MNVFQGCTHKIAPIKVIDRIVDNRGCPNQLAVVLGTRGCDFGRTSSQGFQTQQLVFYGAIDVYFWEEHA